MLEKLRLLKEKCEGDAQDTISLFYDDTYTIEQALKHLERELVEAKQARDEYFKQEY
jgi:hypothetical protein